ncbi:hypothetical protein [Nocardia sp. NPDC052566]|uniref:hypothetical protein n=1 Tax=Nocardia sp. NPDC052566 TaxID=3364330 RepID=UPI0037C9BBA0
MTLIVTDESMSSDRTRERADRLTDQFAAAWRLSWLPERLLTEQQARAGLELAEIIHSTPNLDQDEVALARASRCAGQLHLVVEQARIALEYRRSL